MFIKKSSDVLDGSERSVNVPARIFRIFEKIFTDHGGILILVEGDDFVRAVFPVKIKAFSLLIRPCGI